MTSTEGDTEKKKNKDLVSQEIQMKTNSGTDSTPLKYGINLGIKLGYI